MCVFMSSLFLRPLLSRLRSLSPSLFFFSTAEQQNISTLLAGVSSYLAEAEAQRWRTAIPSSFFFCQCFLFSFFLRRFFPLRLSLVCLISLWGDERDCRRRWRQSKNFFPLSRKYFLFASLTVSCLLYSLGVSLDRSGRSWNHSPWHYQEREEHSRAVAVLNRWLTPKRSTGFELALNRKARLECNFVANRHGKLSMIHRGILWMETYYYFRSE